MAENTHSKIGASSMYRWSRCPGSVKLCESIPSQSSSYADEGTKAHELAAIILKDKAITEFCDEETHEAVDLYVSTVLQDAEENEILVEQKFDLSKIFPGLFGTADAVVYDPISKILRVYDYKHGKGIIVEVENNTQLMYYGLGALLSTNFPCKEVELVIVQPRAYHPDGPVRRWRVTPIDLLEFSADLRDFAEATTKPNASLVAGDHCRFCPASGICSELSKKALAVAQAEFKPTHQYDANKLADTLKKIDILEAYAKGVREFAYREAQSGRCPPGFKLVAKRAVRKWKDEKEAQRKLSNFLDAKEMYNMSLKSPAQIEKIKGKISKEYVNELVVAVSSGLALVEDADPRSPALSSPQKDFKPIKPGENE